MVEIHLNGKKTESTAKTVMDLALEQGLDSSSLIVEVNFAIVPQKDWEAFSIREGDTIELLSFVGGG